ncbi:unnamed protein product [Brassica oleracea]
MVLWCSGYHVCLTRKRSPVRSWAAPFPLFFSNNLDLKKGLFLNSVERLTAKMGCASL